MRQQDKELMTRLARDLTDGIKDMPDKCWMMPALASHVAHLTGLDANEVEVFVGTWWPR